jgi:Peptidase family M1 domain/Peptidase M1 N-terminal domain
MPDTEITRAETRERPRLLLVRSYDVDFDFTRGPHTFGSVSLIRFDCHQPGSTTHAGTGMHRAESAGGSVHIYAKLAQAYARTAYACFDQPDLKAVFTVRVTAPAGWVVLSNQPQADVERTLHDSQTVRFQPTPALPTFTTTVVAGDYHLVTASHTTPGGQRIPLELACGAGLADRLDVDALLPLTARGLDYYTSWLGADYPYAKYGQVFVPEFPHLASEDAGCVLIAERLLFQSSQASPALIESRTGTVLHEMAHMWFGDSATQEWWDDLWLSESFAEFCEAHAQVELGLNADAWSTMSFTMKIPAYRDDRLLSAHPVASGVSTVSDTLTRVGGANVDVAGARTAVPSLLGTARPDLILLNDDDTGYLIVRFDPRSLATVLSSVGGLPDLARPRRVLEHGHRHGAPGGAAGVGVRRDAGAGDPVRGAPGAERPVAAGRLADHAVRSARAGGGNRVAAGKGGSLAAAHQRNVRAGDGHRRRRGPRALLKIKD